MNKNTNRMSKVVGRAHRPHVGGQEVEPDVMLETIIAICDGEGSVTMRERRVIADALKSRDAELRMFGIRAVRIRALWRRFGMEVVRIMRSEKDLLVYGEAVECVGSERGGTLGMSWWKRHLMSKSWLVRIAAINGMTDCRSTVELELLLALREEGHETVIAGALGLLLRKAHMLPAAGLLVALASAAETHTGRCAAANTLGAEGEWLEEKVRVHLKKRLRCALRLEQHESVRSSLRNAIRDLS